MEEEMDDLREMIDPLEERWKPLMEGLLTWKGEERDTRTSGRGHVASSAPPPGGHTPSSTLRGSHAHNLTRARREVGFGANFMNFLCNLMDFLWNSCRFLWKNLRAMIEFTENYLNFLRFYAGFYGKFYELMGFLWKIFWKIFWKNSKSRKNPIKPA